MHKFIGGVSNHVALASCGPRRAGMAGLGRNAAGMGAYAATDEDTGVETGIKESVTRETAIVLILTFSYPPPLDRPLWRSFQLADVRRSDNEHFLNFYPLPSITVMPFTNASIQIPIDLRFIAR
jgi:hypothetical protein